MSIYTLFRLTNRESKIVRLYPNFVNHDAPAPVQCTGTNRSAHTMDIINLLQWPAMLVTVIAAWLVASLSKRKRETGFWCFLLSNVLWILWGYHDHAYALIALQFALAALNLRGARKNDPAAGNRNDE
jgi:hypothetical protein